MHLGKGAKYSISVSSVLWLTRWFGRKPCCCKSCYLRIWGDTKRSLALWGAGITDEGRGIHAYLARLRVLGWLLFFLKSVLTVASNTCLLPPLIKVETVLHDLIYSVELKHCGHYSQVHRMTKELMVDGVSYWDMTASDLQPALTKLLESSMGASALGKEDPSSLFPSSVRNWALAKYKVTSKEYIYVFILLFHGTVSRRRGNLFFLFFFFFLEK